MNAPQLALAALLSTLAAAPSLAQPLAQPLTPIINGPAGAGECVVGVDACGAGPGLSMDPMAEGVLVGLGEPAAPTTPAPAKIPGKISVSKADAPPAPDETDAVARLGVGIGGIINPPGGFVASKGAPPAAGPATLGAAFGGANDSIEPMGAPGQSGTPQTFSFHKMQKAATAASLLEKDVPAPDAKLNPDDSNLAPGSIRAASNAH
jgi:hypothetical protein